MFGSHRTMFFCPPPELAQVCYFPAAPAFFFSYNAEVTASRTASCKETIGSVRYPIQPIVGIDMLYLVRQWLVFFIAVVFSSCTMNCIACTATNDFPCIIDYKP